MPYNKPMSHRYIRCEWDDEARVWYVAESDVPGLAVEAETSEAMLRKLEAVVPELLALNGTDATVDVPVTLLWKGEQELHFHSP